MADESQVMTAREAASYLGMPLKTLCRLAEKGKIPANKVNNEWHFSRTTLESWKTEQ